MASKAKASTRKPALEKRQSSFAIGIQTLELKTPRSARGTRGKSSMSSKIRSENTSKASQNESQKKDDKQDFDKEAEKQFDRMLEGKMDNLPHLPRSVVRIFVSSTFSDMHAERDTLSREVFPKLQKFCAGLNLDFQVVDMRWGVTEDSQNDHSVEKICLQEVENCQKMSLGPNFVAIIGDRYGFRPIPTEMDVKMFETLRAIAKDKNVNGSQLMDVWYQLDENSEPPQYVLQPIRSQFPFFGDYSPGCDEPRAKDTKNWQTTFNELQSALREAAVVACNTKKLTNEQLHEYFLSVTELEISRGILDAKNPAAHVAVFHREIYSFGDLSDPKTGRYVDTESKDGKVIFNEEIRDLQATLKTKIQKIVNGSNIYDYRVMWREGGINSKEHIDHKEYLNNFCTSFYDSLVDLTEKAVKERHSKVRRSEYYSDYQEILHHLEFCQIKCETFCGRDKVLSCAKQYIMDSSVRKPLVLHAPSGAGKTAVMAMIMNSLSSWIGKAKYVGVIRFLGTSPLSTNIYDVLRSVCGQLADNAGIIMEPVGYKNMKNLVEYMPRFLRRVASTLKCPIVILLDSLDQLSKLNDAHSLDWLPTTLPANMKFLVSTLPKEHNILDNLLEVLQDKDSYVEVPSLPEQTGREMIDKYLKKKKRTLTLSQQKLLINAFSLSPGPLFLKLMLDEAAKWNSYTPQHHLILQDSVQGAINQLFDNLEKKFGIVVVGRAIGYITVSKNGISENELEDVLSCDDEALDDVYRYHNPPVEGIVRIPPVIAARIRYDIKEYLVERISQDKYTMNWYHRQFIETATSRYATGKDGEKLHKNLCEIFMAENGVKRDITLTRRKLTVPNADRQVTPQPITEKNKRMLTCLPYHIIHANTELPEKTAKENCFFKFDFIKTKLAAYHVDVFLGELNDYLDRNEDEEIQILRYFLSVSKTDLSNANKCAVSMLSCISCDDNHTYLKALLTQAESFLTTRKNTSLIPVFSCLAPRRDTSSALQDTYENVSEIVAESVDSVLVQTLASSEESEGVECYKLLRTANCEFEEIPISVETNSKLYPVLDKGGKTIIHDTKGSLSLLTLSNKRILSRKYEEISSDSSSGSKKVLALIHSSDTSHVVLHFDNGDIMLVEVTGLKHVGTWTLLEEEEDIAGILCTSIDNLKVIVAVKSEAKDSCGKFRIFKPDQENDILVNVEKSFTNGILGISSLEQLITYASNSDSSSSVVSMEIDKTLFISDIPVTGNIHQLSLSRTKPLAGLITENGEVSILHLKEGICLQNLENNNPVTQIGFSWIHSLAILGDNQGQITLYNCDTGKHFGGFPAHVQSVKEVRVLDDYMLSVGKDKELRIWSLSELVDDIREKNHKHGAAAQGLLAQTGIISFDIHPNGQVLITASENRMLRLWSITDAKFQRELDIGISAGKIRVAAGDICIALDLESEKIKMIDLTALGILSADVPTNVLDFTLNKEKTIVYTISKKDKLLYITEIDLSLRKVKKKFPLKPGLQFEAVSISLSDSERYLVLTTKITPKEYKEIEASWKKQGSFLPQAHPNKFIAVDLQQATGGLLPCFRNLTKIPHLGEVIHANTGNVMVISTRRWIIFWDIPTGKCDQRVCKNKDIGMMYRPCWLGSDCKGTGKALVQSKDGHLMAVGSEDGYLFIYEVHSGYPVGEKKPSTKHSASVTTAVFSPDSCWVASSCENNYLKLWDCQTASEVFSTRVGSEVRSMSFSSDSKYLVALCGTYITRVLVYRLHTGNTEN